MVLVASYRQLFRLVGSGYVVVAFVGRLPLAMCQLGTLLLISAATGRYALGGLAAGSFAVANAVGAPVAGSIADRIGQRPVVLGQSLAAGVALTGLVVATEAGGTPAVLVVCAVVAGLAMPQVGPLARTRWRPIVGPADGDRRLVDAAFSYEGAADEASFVLGPALVGLAVVLFSPAGGLLIAAALLTVFGTWFGLHPTARLAHDGRLVDRSARRFVTPELAVLGLAQLLIGVVFGATQTGTAVLATVAGRPGLAGLVHALLAVGSVLAGLAAAGLPRRFGYERRIAASAAGLLVMALPLLTVDSLAGLVPVVLVLGCAVAPYMISVFALAERIVSPLRAAAAMTVLSGATGIGYAVGSAVAGRLADDGGHRPAFAVTVVAAALSLALALATLRRLAIAQRATQPTPSLYSY